MTENQTWALPPAYEISEPKGLSYDTLVAEMASGLIALPETQREYVWPPSLMIALVDSILMGLPPGVGQLTTFVPTDDEAVTTAYSSANGSVTPNRYLLDGQQRAISGCLLMGRKPDWMSPNLWESLVKTHQVQINLTRYAELRAAKASTAERRKAIKICSADRSTKRGWINLTELLGSPKRISSNLIAGAKPNRQVPDEAILPLLETVRARVLKCRFVDTTLTCSAADACSAFVELNHPQRVTAAELALAMAALTQPTWVRDTFREFKTELAKDGWYPSNSLLLRSLIAAAAGKTRLTAYSSDIWTRIHTEKIWDRVADALRATFAGLREHGIGALRELGAENIVIPLVLVEYHFPKQRAVARNGQLVTWTICCLRSLRYKSQQSERLKDDLRAVAAGAVSLDDAIARLYGLLTGDHEFKPFTAEEMMSVLPPNTRRPYELALRMALSDAGACDWDSDGSPLVDAMRSGSTDLHHVFPRAYCHDAGLLPQYYDVLANMVVVSSKMNQRFGTGCPAKALQDRQVNPVGLDQQQVGRWVMESRAAGDVHRLTQERAPALAEMLNNYIRANWPTMGVIPAHAHARRSRPSSVSAAA